MTDNETANPLYEECDPSIDPMVAIRDAEALANEYRRELLDMTTENSQLYYDYDVLYDTVLSVCNRIKAVEKWGTEPSMMLDEIKEMLFGVIE